MEVTAAERSITYTEAQSLAQKINNYILTNRSSIANVAKLIGYSRTTVSRYLAGKYDSDPTDLENKLAEFLAHETGEAVEVSAPGRRRSSMRAGTRRQSSACARAVRSTSGSASWSPEAATARPTPSVNTRSSPASPTSSATTP